MITFFLALGRAARLACSLAAPALLLATAGPARAQAPTLATLSPGSGVQGTSITLTDTNLTGARAVSFNGMAVATFAVTNATTATATITLDPATLPGSQVGVSYPTIGVSASGAAAALHTGKRGGVRCGVGRKKRVDSARPPAPLPPARKSRLFYHKILFISRNQYL